jgi:hypothetical protein
MSSIRALANLLCARCGDVTLHASNVCQRDGCGQINRDSGNPPVPRPRPFGYSAMKHAQYNQARAEQGNARRRARRARHQFHQRGHT